MLRLPQNKNAVAPLFIKVTTVAFNRDISASVLSIVLCPIKETFIIRSLHFVEFHEGGYMNINDAIIKRIEEICAEKNINVCEATLGGGKSPSAIYDLIKGRTKCSKVSTIKAFCQGAGITLSEFFDKEYFNDFEE